MTSTTGVVLPTRLVDLAPRLPWLVPVCSGGMVLASVGLRKGIAVG